MKSIYGRIKRNGRSRACSHLLMFFFMCSCAHMFMPAESLANNISITNVSLEDRDSAANTAVVEFDISWDNSWKVNDEPGNHDAVWVFLKVCKGGVCSPLANTAWVHGMLKTAGIDPADTDSGSNSDLQIEIPADKVGAFLSRKATGTGTMSSSNVRLRLDYNAAPLSAGDTDVIQVRVSGIEMVYVSEGSFYAGDTTSPYTLKQGSADTDPWLIDSEDEIEVEDVVSNGYYYPGGGDVEGAEFTIREHFPKGYNAFYLMKYEMTQGQYRDFLNTLTQAQQNTRTEAVLTNEDDANTYVMVSEDQASVSYRQTIKAGSNPADGMPYTFGCDLNDNDVLDEFNDGQWIAMNYLSWMDLVAYADWSGLRPMTELEFEKAARGPLTPVAGEYAWGSVGVTRTSDPILSAGQNNETASNSGSGLANYDTSGIILGPLRVGFAATSASSREDAAAGYYGAMNLSDNVWEQVVTIGNSAGRAFTGTHGDGILTTTSSYEGNATNTDWPGIDATPARGVTGATGGGIKGGNWGGAAFMQLSERENAYDGSGSRSELAAGRLARTAGFWCGSNFDLAHNSSRGVAPFNTTITYGTVSTNLTGTDKCWITQNLGASQQATAATDNTAASAGWYWQFNRKQGYSHDGTTLTPAWTITAINESSNWIPANDPCTIEFGPGWRLPTSTEWTNADSNGSWGDYDDAYASVLKIHAAGYLGDSDGSLGGRGSYGYYWCSTQFNSTNGYNLDISGVDCSVFNDDKAYGFSGRCLKD